MKNRKPWQRILIVGTFIFSICVSTLFFNTSTVEASVKLPKCNKIGQIFYVKKTAYRCVSSQGLLKWKVDISKQTNPSKTNPSTKPIASSASPSPTAIPAAVEDPRMIEIKMALDKQIEFKSLASIDDSIIGKIVAEPGIDEVNLVETKKVLQQIYLANSIFKLQKPPVVILAYSAEFIKLNFPKYCDENFDGFPYSWSPMDKWENWAFASCLYKGPVQVIPMPKSGEAIAHIQGALGSDLGYLPIGISDNTSKLPGWFVRGLKGVVGEYATSMGGKVWNVPVTGVRNCLSFSLAQLSFSYQDITSNYCVTPLGQSASRYMVAIKGLKPTLAFINELQKTGIWSEAIFSEFLGIPFAQFEKEAKDYARNLD